MSTIRSFRTGAADRLDRHLGRDVADQDLARERVAAVDHHRVRAADPAHAPERQRAVEVPLHVVERLHQPLVRVHVDRELVPPRIVGDLGLNRRIRSVSVIRCGPADAALLRGVQDLRDADGIRDHQYLRSIGM